MSRLTVDKLVSKALHEDIGSGDITVALTVPKDATCWVRLMAKSGGVISGIVPFRRAFDFADANVSEWTGPEDGARYGKDQELASFRGAARGVLAAERTALNFLQHLSGVATLTSKFVKAVEGTKARVCDTRKTTPLLRALEKAAVVHGGGVNHRTGLYDGILIKDNHIAAVGGLEEAVRRARGSAHHLLRVEVEIASPSQLEAAIVAGADVVLLDNMSLVELQEAVTAADGRVLLEASGNVSLKNVRAVADTGVDLISVGALTHSAPAADLSLQVTLE